MKIGHKFLGAIGASFPDSLYCKLINLRCAFRGRTFRLIKSDTNPYFEGIDKGEKITIARRNRFKRYDKGIMRWIEILARSYCLEAVPFKKNDVIIDCGANIGEIGVWAKKFGANYIPFEPEEAEADCSDFNNFNGNKTTQRKALWFEDSVLEFFSKPGTADSSAIEINDYDEVKRIEAITLDGFVKSQGIKSIKLLKLEAEGAEPEVLKGALKSLKIMDYVAVDCGFERGKQQDATFNEVNTILVKNNFFIVTANLKRPVFLYKRDK